MLRHVGSVVTAFNLIRVERGKVGVLSVEAAN